MLPPKKRPQFISNVGILALVCSCSKLKVFIRQGMGVQPRLEEELQRQYRSSCQLGQDRID